MSETQKRVLLIDDDTALRELLALWLGLQGYELLQASNGLDGMQILKREQVDLIMVDLMMPVMDGLVFVHWVRNEAQLSLPVLVLTARVKADTEAAVLKAGATALLYKPVNKAALQQRLHALETAP